MDLIALGEAVHRRHNYPIILREPELTSTSAPRSCEMPLLIPCGLSAAFGDCNYCAAQIISAHVNVTLREPVNGFVPTRPVFFTARQPKPSRVPASAASLAPAWMRPFQ